MSSTQFSPCRINRASGKQRRLVERSNCYCVELGVTNGKDTELSCKFFRDQPLVAPGSSDPDENYLSFMVKNVFSVFENAVILKYSETKGALTRIIGTCATNYQIPLWCTIMCFNFASGSKI
ncbi:uncharacterized protein LOC125856654 [Solanum stenotomum]|uniref:uncharacterized protein LOC125856654 n=1 Tax=Solanum stenotomum TaxID=172797 RepID=UPI0020D01187|nr:uncharacterized protein LOC125856654 [Solanum stenotomum]